MFIKHVQPVKELENGTSTYRSINEARHCIGAILRKPTKIYPNYRRPGSQLLLKEFNSVIGLIRLNGKLAPCTKACVILQNDQVITSFPYIYQAKCF